MNKTIKQNKLLKNAFIAGVLFQKTAKKQIKKNFGVLFEDSFYASLSKPLSNGKTVGETLKNAATNGKCYFYALMLATALPKCTLVHGNLRKLDYVGDSGGYYELFDHAWVEDEKFVYDTTSKTRFEKSAYYENYGVEAVEKFNKTDLQNKQTFSKLAKHATKLHTELSQNIFTEFEQKMLK